MTGYTGRFQFSRRPLGSDYGPLMATCYMTEVWLRTNRRVLLLAMVLPGLLGALGGYFLIGESETDVRIACVVWIVFALLLVILLAREAFKPRISCRDGEVLFRLQKRQPIAVPVAVVEAFFQGQGPAHLPGETRHQAKSINLIARLSQRETDWQQRDVKPALGNWSDGYVTIRGTWCEPITEDLIRRLNRRLGAAKRERAGVAPPSNYL